MWAHFLRITFPLVKHIFELDVKRRDRLISELFPFLAWTYGKIIEETKSDIQ